MMTRRELFSKLASALAVIPLMRICFGEKTKFKEQFKNDKFYDWFLDNDGRFVDGKEIRCFLDWTPEHPEQPRWARIARMASYRNPEAYQECTLVTYLDSELHPVEKVGKTDLYDFWRRVDNGKTYYQFRENR